MSLLVEMAGLPGCGKTTLIKDMVSLLRNQGREAQGSGGLIDSIAKLPKSVGYAPNNASLLPLYYATQTRFAHPEFFAHVDAMGLPSDRIAFYFAHTAMLYGAHARHTPDDGIAILDEGFVQRGVAAALETGEPSGFVRYAELAPTPDILLFGEIPPEEALERAIARRAHLQNHRKKVIRKLGDLASFQRRADVFEQALGFAERRGVRVVRVNMTESPSECATNGVLGVLAAERDSVAVG